MKTKNSRWNARTPLRSIRAKNSFALTRARLFCILLLCLLLCTSCTPKESEQDIKNSNINLENEENDNNENMDNNMDPDDSAADYEPYPVKLYFQEHKLQLKKLAEEEELCSYIIDGLYGENYVCFDSSGKEITNSAGQLMDVYEQTYFLYDPKTKEKGKVLWNAEGNYATHCKVAEGKNYISFLVGIDNKMMTQIVEMDLETGESKVLVQEECWGLTGIEISNGKLGYVISTNKDNQISYKFYLIDLSTYDKVLIDETNCTINDDYLMTGEVLYYSQPTGDYWNYLKIKLDQENVVYDDTGITTIYQYYVKGDSIRTLGKVKCKLNYLNGNDKGLITVDYHYDNPSSLAGRLYYMDQDGLESFQTLYGIQTGNEPDQAYSNGDDALALLNTTSLFLFDFKNEKFGRVNFSDQKPENYYMTYIDYDIEKGILTLFYRGDDKNENVIKKVYEVMFP